MGHFSAIFRPLLVAPVQNLLSHPVQQGLDSYKKYFENLLDIQKVSFYNIKIRWENSDYKFWKDKELKKRPLFVSSSSTTSVIYKGVQYWWCCCSIMYYGKDKNLDIVSFFFPSGLLPKSVPKKFCCPDLICIRRYVPYFFFSWGDSKCSKSKTRPNHYFFLIQATILEKKV